MVRDNSNYPQAKDGPLTLAEVGEKALKYVAALPKQPFFGRIEITFEAGKEHLLRTQKDTLAKNVV